MERILLAAARAHAVVDDPAANSALHFMRSRYAMADASLQPGGLLAVDRQLGWRCPCASWSAPRGVREVKDRISRQILDELGAAGIGLASATYNIVGLPEIRLGRPGTPEGRQTEHVPGDD